MEQFLKLISTHSFQCKLWEFGCKSRQNPVSSWRFSLPLLSSCLDVSLSLDIIKPTHLKPDPLEKDQGVFLHMTQSSIRYFRTSLHTQEKLQSAISATWQDAGERAFKSRKTMQWFRVWSALNKWTLVDTGKRARMEVSERWRLLAYGTYQLLQMLRKIKKLSYWVTTRS